MKTLRTLATKNKNCCSVAAAVAAAVLVVADAEEVRWWGSGGNCKKGEILPEKEKEETHLLTLYLALCFL